MCVPDLLPSQSLLCQGSKSKVPSTVASTISAVKGIAVQDCQSSLVEMEWKKGSSPLQDGTSSLVCCLMCHAEILSLCQVRHGRTVIARGGQRRRGRGRGRGGRKGRSKTKEYDSLMSFSDF